MIPKNLVEGRNIVDTYRVNHTKLKETIKTSIPYDHIPLIDKMKKDIVGLGFKSLDDFFIVNQNYCNNATEVDAELVSILWQQQNQ